MLRKFLTGAVLVGLLTAFAVPAVLSWESGAWDSFVQAISSGTYPANFSSLQVGSVSDTEFGYLDGVSSTVQTQLDARALESVVGESLGTGLSLTGSTLNVAIASTVFVGISELSTNTEAVTGTAIDRVTTPANITAKMSAPGAIGDTTPSTGSFTTLTAIPDGTNEVFQVNDGTIDYTDGNAGTAGVTTIDSAGNLSHAKEIRATAVNTLVNAIGDTGGGTDDIDLHLGTTVTATVSTGAQTFTFSNPPPSGTEGTFLLILTNGQSQGVITWPVSVNWPGEVQPVLTWAGVDLLSFTTVDGGTIYHGSVIALDSK